jgi:hypothetical protein
MRGGGRDCLTYCYKVTEITQGTVSMGWWESNIHKNPKSGRDGILINKEGRIR